jgi:hypothetical protein
MSSITVLGATGHTGKQVIDKLMQLGVAVRVGSRDPERARTVFDERIEVARFDASEPVGLAGFVEAGDVVVNCIGPYSGTGLAIAEAAVASGAHYVDCSGESGHLRKVVDTLHSRALEAGVVVLPGFGFESVPGHLTAAAAIAASSGTGRTLRTLYVCDPRAASTGTWESALLSATEDGHSLQSRVRVEKAIASELFDLDWAGRGFHGFSIGTTEPLFLERTYGDLSTIVTYLGGPGLAGRAFTTAARCGRAAGRTKLGASLLERLSRMNPTSGSISDASLRPALVLSVLADEYGSEVSRAGLGGGDPYSVTSSLLAFAAVDVGRSFVAGVRGPLEVFDLETLNRVVADVGMLPMPVGAEDLLGSPVPPKIEANEVTR